MACYQDMADDFDEDVEDAMIAENDWRRTAGDIRKTGYRLGLSAGQEETLQQGFDAGYREAALISYAFGLLQGRISTKLIFLEKSLSTPETPPDEEGVAVASNLKALLQDCQHVVSRLPSTLPPLCLSEVQRADYPGACWGSTPRSASNGQSCSSCSGPASGEPECSTQTDDVGEITKLLGALGVHGLPPIRHPEINQVLVRMWHRYRSLSAD